MSFIESALEEVEKVKSFDRKNIGYFIAVLDQMRDDAKKIAEAFEEEEIKTLVKNIDEKYQLIKDNVSKKFNKSIKNIKMKSVFLEKVVVKGL